MSHLRVPLAALALGVLATASLSGAGCARGGLEDDDGGVGPMLDGGRADAGPRPDAGECLVTCPDSETCRHDRCFPSCDPDTPCAAGLTCCAGACVDTRTVFEDCGACDRACNLFSDRCESGACRCGEGTMCTGTSICCDGECLEATTSRENCGGCGVMCEVGEGCVDGMCVPEPCDPPCGLGETCVDAECRCGTGLGCETGQTCCGSACVTVSNSRTHCGGCGNACAVGEDCVGGSCTADVPCDPPCPVGHTCSAGTCRCGDGAACSAGSTCCSGSCRNTGSDPLSCGGCGIMCGVGQSCCAGSCVDTSSNRSHCGGCGNSCGDGADTCSGGSCRCGSGPACLIPPCFLGECIFF